MAINAGAPVKIKGTSITTPQATGANHTLVLGQLKETTEIAQRLRGDPGDSFVRVNELVSALGARLVNGTVQPPLPGTAAAITVANSILGAGTLAAPLTLDGDTSAPGNTMLYGTNGSGIKGWYAQPAAGTTSPLTTKGDLWGWSTTNVRVPVGTNGKVLTADSTNTAGVSWQTNAASGVGPAGPAIFLAGEPGEDGERGPPGSPGATGTPGSTGAQGPTGPPIFLEADAGADGDMGPPGATGATGTPGSTGAQGPTGPPIYLVGDSGDDGEHGPPGSTGAQGPQGTTGTTGNTGAQGPTGPPIFLEADAGADGDPGPPGATGPQGAAGTNGAPGSTGAQGPMGPPIFLEADSYISDESISYAATIYGAAPSVGIGLTGKNGIANTYMRSDAAPALDQSITPTWVGTHVFNSGTMFPAQVTAGADLGGLLVNGAQNNVGLTLNNTQAGATANWRISSSATGSGFGAGNLAIGSGSTQYANFLGTTGELHLLNTIGSVYGGQFALINSSVGATNTAKYFRINPTGGLELINSAYSVALLSITDAGAMNAASTITGAGMVSNAQGFFASAGAATQVSALTVNQTGQAQWVLYQAASSNDLRVFGNGADRATFFSDGGFTMGSPTGGDKGSGTINAIGLYVNGVAVSTGGAAAASQSGFEILYNEIVPEEHWPQGISTEHSGDVSNSLATFNAGVLINSPPTGTALQVTGAAGTTFPAQTNISDGISLQTQAVTTAGFSYIRMNDNAGTRRLEILNLGSAASTVYGATAGNNVINSASGTSLTFSMGDTARVVVGSGGNVVVNTPASGTSFTANGTVNGSAIFSATDGTIALNVWTVSSSAQLGTAGAHSLQLLTNSVARMAIDPTGGIFTSGATGSGQGSGTFNATGYFLLGKSITNIDAVKAALTSRASTVVLANDPNLVIAIPVAGTYEVELVFNAWNTASAAAGVSWNLNYSGTFTAASSFAAPAGNNSGLTYVVTSSLIAAAATTSMFSNNVAVTAATATVMIVKGTLVATGTGNLGFAWAEAATNATGTNVGAGSRLSARRIA